MKYIIFFLLCFFLLTAAPRAEASSFDIISQPFQIVWQKTTSWISKTSQKIRLFYIERRAIAEGEFERKQEELKEEVKQEALKAAQGAWEKFWNNVWNSIQQNITKILESMRPE
ncbi:MAG: hypothetical protein Q8P71_00905 [bacterium]|nr:hypothetical protein [bacterium]